MIATVKIIPFATSEAALEAALAAARQAVHPRRALKIRKVGVVSTLLPGLATKVVEKTLRVTDERAGACRRQHRRREARAARSARGRARRSTRC